jgi:hypothetical protein
MSEAKVPGSSPPPLDHPVLLGVHTPESWTRAVLAAGVRALVNMKGPEGSGIAAISGLDAKLTVFFHPNGNGNGTKVGAVLEFEGQSFAVEV